MRHDAMKAYVQALDARDFVLLCNVVREERRRRESSAAGFTVIAGLLDLLEMTSTAAFGAIGAVVPGTRVHILARVCRRARKIVDRALLASLLGLVLRPKPSASKQQLESLAFGRLGSGTVQLLLDRGMDSLIAPLIDRMQVAVKQQAWGGLRSLRIAGCPNIEVYNSGEEEPPAWEAPAGLSSPMIQLCQLLPSFCLLEKLELVESGLSNEAACQIAEGIASARNLKTLDLSGNDVSALICQQGCSRASWRLCDPCALHPTLNAGTCTCSHVASCRPTCAELTHWGRRSGRRARIFWPRASTAEPKHTEGP
jgi:hypothetical protein